MPETYKELRRQGRYLDWKRKVTGGINVMRKRPVSNASLADSTQSADRLPEDRRREYHYYLVMRNWLEDGPRVKVKAGYSATPCDIMALAMYEWLLFDHLYVLLARQQFAYAAIRLPRSTTNKSELHRQLMTRGSLMQEALVPGRARHSPTTGDSYLTSNVPELRDRIVNLSERVLASPWPVALAQERLRLARQDASTGSMLPRLESELRKAQDIVALDGAGPDTPLHGGLLERFLERMPSR